MNRKSFLFFILSIGITAYSQKTYFQQAVDYKIKVSLDDEAHMLRAFETIEYTNNSPDELTYIWMHIWPNAYKNNQTEFAKQQLENGSTNFYYTDDENRGYIDSLDFKVNGESIKVEYSVDTIDICKLLLNEPLKPGKKISISTPFMVKLPGDFSRMGHVGQSYQVTQWYPKPAVYDKTGWHQMPYLDQGEFYSEFGSFEVDITLSDNYVVGATGEIQNPEEWQWLLEKNEQTRAIDTFNYKDNSTPESSQEMKTLKYTCENVHDFAWFADKRYNVLIDSVKLPSEDRWVTTISMFLNNQSKYWVNSQEYIQDAITKYSAWYGNYPYKYCTAVQGAISAGGAMEYPTITVVGNSQSSIMLEEMIMHEVGHNWFYGILGFNERDYPFLDEGINSFSEFRYMEEKYGTEKYLYEMFIPLKIAELANIETLPLSKYYSISAFLPMSIYKDQPMFTHSNQLIQINYGSIVYHKSVLAFAYLMNYMGEEEFNNVMRKFYQDWKFKHPDPDDLEKAFTEGTDKNISWFFNDIVKTTKKLDYKIVRAKDNKVLVRNIGEIASPVNLKGYSVSGEKEFDTWSIGFSGKQWIDVPTTEVYQIKLNKTEIPEPFQQNNTFKTSGLFKKLEPIELNIIQILDKPDKTQIGILPAMAMNNYNKYMLGAFLYSPAIPFKRVEYQLAPMYAFGNNDLAGMGKITWRTSPDIGFTERIDISVSGMQFGRPDSLGISYNKLKGQMDFFLKKKNARSYISQKVILSCLLLNNLYHEGTTSHFNLNYKLKNRSKLQPYSVSVLGEMNDGALRTSASFKYKINTQKAKNQFYIRLFGGFSTNQDKYPFYLSGGSSADIQADELYLGRYEQYGNSWLAQQYSANDGGFISSSTVSAKLMLTAQIEVKIPKVPIRAYGSIGTFSEPIDNGITNIADFEDDGYLVYEAGFMTNITPVLKVYFPLVESENINNYIEGQTNSYGQKIKFSLNINAINLFDYRESLF
ncbi:MAG: M1 family metallopeptidase [Bacteroidales bacterium]|nr:M1 family metallopeptidase [Bacteroidales bacterium]MBN2821389.1 M1 family metallopeptidase [Bacteroidales bacterium]